MLTNEQVKAAITRRAEEAWRCSDQKRLSRREYEDAMFLRDNPVPGFDDPLTVEEASFVYGLTIAGGKLYLPGDSFPLVFKE